MDLYEFESSEQKEEVDNNSSSGGCKTTVETLSTDHDRNTQKKSKIIKKNYEPIRDGNIFIRYEDDPQQYKRLRKKIQNRESAARIRGRKKGTMESLETQVQELKKVNSELMLKNATLQTQNRSLKNQVEFLRGIVKPSRVNQHPQSIDKYLDLNPNSKTEMKDEQHFQSPFIEQDSALSWVRSPVSVGSRSNWSTLFVLTILVCVFVLPSDNSVSNTIIAQQTGTKAIISQSPNLLQRITSYGKIMIKYLALIGYLLFGCSFIYTKYYKRKLKKV